ncbi:MAG: hypothetical protein K9M36_02385 [Candidatus Pacebacteria bacterium]|nr:hypothetical protein [Candidatus Paceibacterota bacterium]
MNESNFGKPKIESKENSEILLSERDRGVLLECGEGIAKHLKEDWAEKLPDYVIYVDTTARPLAYLFDPVWEKLAKEKGQEKPQTIFFPTAEGSRNAAQKFLWLTLDKKKFSIEKLKEKITHLEDSANASERQDSPFDDYESFKNVCLLYIAAIEKLEVLSKDMSQKPSIAIFDEYMSSGHSIAFLEFLFANYVNEQKSYVLGRSSIGPMWVGLEENVRVGGIDDKYDFYNEDRKSFQLQYSVKDKNAKGVVKPIAPAVFSSVDPDRDIKAVKQIRKEMREIGEEISKKI